MIDEVVGVFTELINSMSHPWVGNIPSDAYGVYAAARGTGVM